MSEVYIHQNAQCNDKNSEFHVYIKIPSSKQGFFLFFICRETNNMENVIDAHAVLYNKPTNVTSILITLTIM